MMTSSLRSRVAVVERQLWNVAYRVRKFLALFRSARSEKIEVAPLAYAPAIFVSEGNLGFDPNLRGPLRPFLYDYFQIPYFSASRSPRTIKRRGLQKRVSRLRGSKSVGSRSKSAVAVGRFVVKKVDYAGGAHDEKDDLNGRGNDELSPRLSRESPGRVRGENREHGPADDPLDMLALLPVGVHNPSSFALDKRECDANGSDERG